MFHAPATSARRALSWTSAALGCATLAGFASVAGAHGISKASRDTMAVGGIVDFIGLGAEHMVTGYDHLLFLFGVVFFLTGFRDVVRFITAFTLGHCITLLGATLAGITANAYLVDAVIALSVVYKGFENLGGFEKRFGVRTPNLLLMVFIFGLIHGFGLATRLQELPLGDEGLVSRILAFNVGVEIGQVAALTAMLGFFAAWRSTKTFERFGSVTNMGLVLAGAGLFVFQMVGYAGGHDHAHEEAAEAAPHDDDGGNEGSASPARPEPDPGQDALGANPVHGQDHAPANLKAGSEPHGRAQEHPKPGSNVEPPTHGRGDGHARPAPKAERPPRDGELAKPAPKAKNKPHVHKRKKKRKRKHRHGSGKAHTH